MHEYLIAAAIIVIILALWYYGREKLAGPGPSRQLEAIYRSMNRHSWRVDLADPNVADPIMHVTIINRTDTEPGSVRVENYDRSGQRTSWGSYKFDSSELQSYADRIVFFRKKPESNLIIQANGSMICTQFEGNNDTRICGHWSAIPTSST